MGRTTPEKMPKRTSSGGPAVIGSSLRPVTLRPRVSDGFALFQSRRYLWEETLTFAPRLSVGFFFSAELRRLKSPFACRWVHARRNVRGTASSRIFSPTRTEQHCSNPTGFSWTAWAIPSNVRSTRRRIRPHLPPVHTCVYVLRLDFSQSTPTLPRSYATDRRLGIGHPRGERAGERNESAFDPVIPSIKGCTRAHTACTAIQPRPWPSRATLDRLGSCWKR